MRPAPGFHVEWVDDEAVILDSDTGKLHYLNPPAALFYALVLEEGFRPAVKRIRKTLGIRFRRKKELAALIRTLEQEGLLVDE